jgi:uncharacterized membrane protein YebE (DUF533 family)
MTGARLRRTAVYIAVTLVFGAMLYRVENNYHEDIARNQIVLDQLAAAQRQDCAQSAAGRLVLRDVIVAATSGGGGIDYERIPSFVGLDPEVQQFLRDIRTLSLAGGPDQVAFRQSLLDRAPVIVCDPPPPPKN